MSVVEASDSPVPMVAVPRKCWAWITLGLEMSLTDVQGKIAHLEANLAQRKTEVSALRQTLLARAAIDARARRAGMPPRVWAVGPHNSQADSEKQARPAELPLRLTANPNTALHGMSFPHGRDPAICSLRTTVADVDSDGHRGPMP